MRRGIPTILVTSPATHEPDQQEISDSATAEPQLQFHFRIEFRAFLFRLQMPGRLSRLVSISDFDSEEGMLEMLTSHLLLE